MICLHSRKINPILKSLKYSEDYLYSLLERNPNGIYIMDQNGRFQYCNESYEVLTGYKGEDLLGRSASRLIESNDLEKLVYYFQTALKGEAQEFECTFISKTGLNRVVNVTNIPVYQDNKVIAVYGITQDITEQKIELEKHTYFANFDSLTGLLTRRRFVEMLDDTLSKAKQNEDTLAVLFIDLDRFKSINDSFGHETGDLLLKEVSKRIKVCLRDNDLVARVGGDEFVLLLKGIDQENISKVARRLLQSLGKAYAIQGNELRVTPSIGITLYPDDGEIDDVVKMINNADAAMYRAKQMGKNHYQFFDSELSSQLSRRMKIEKGLQQALVNDDFDLVFQPQFNLDSGNLVGAEVLLRWKHKEIGIVPPDEFIPIAEEAGLIIPIGEWVLQKAVIQNKEWQDSGYDPIRIGVNFSLRQLELENIVEIVQRTFKEIDLRPEYIELEITESVMQESETSIQFLKELKNLGVNVSIDDFGTGYSSLRYLKELPINNIKIDKSFVNDITATSKDLAIISSIIQLAHTLDLKVLAEGIETKEQMEILKSIHCNEGQGYYFSRPLSAVDFVKQFLVVT